MEPTVTTVQQVDVPPLSTDLPAGLVLPDKVQFLARLPGGGRRWWEYYFVLENRSFFLLVPHRRAILWRPIDAPWLGFYGNSETVDAKDTAINWYNSDVSDMREAMENLLSKLPNEVLERAHDNGCHALDPCDECLDAQAQLRLDKPEYHNSRVRLRDEQEMEERQREYDEVREWVKRAKAVN